MLVKLTPNSETGTTARIKINACIDEVNNLSSTPDLVTSVNTKLGDVVLTTDDIAEGNNKYYTDSRFDASFGAKKLDDLSDVSVSIPKELSVFTYDIGTSTWNNGKIMAFERKFLDNFVPNPNFVPHELNFSSRDASTEFGFQVAGLDRSAGYAPIGSGSLDLVTGDDKMLTKGTGPVSIGVGWNLTGDGYGSITSGWDNYSNGNYCIMTGISNTTSGGGMIVSGIALDGTGMDAGIICGSANTIPSGNLYSLQVGNGTFHANSYGGLQPGDRAYVADVRSDAFRVYASGVIEAPSCTDTLIDSTGDKALITKEYADANYTGGGGGGDVTGPNSSLDGTIATFNGTSGKVIKDSYWSPDTNIWNAAKIAGKLVTSETPTDGQVLVYDSTRDAGRGAWVPTSQTGPGPSTLNKMSERFNITATQELAQKITLQEIINPLDHLFVFFNGMYLEISDDFTISGKDINFNVNIKDGDKVVVKYSY